MYRDHPTWISWNWRTHTRYIGKVILGKLAHHLCRGMPSAGKKVTIDAGFGLFRINVVKLKLVPIGEVDDAFFTDENASKSMDQTFHVIFEVGFLVGDLK